MCTFISLTLNADADPNAVAATFAQCGFRFSDASLVEGMPADSRHLVHDGGRCDCDTAIGAGRGEQDAFAPEDVDALRRKGWSAAKIERWKAQKRDAETKNRRADHDRRRAAHNDLAAWMDLIRALLDTPTVKRVGLMYDFYSTGPGYDRLPLAVQTPEPVARLDDDRLFHLTEGTLLQWTR